MQPNMIVVESDSFHLALMTHVVRHKKLEARVKFCSNGRSTIAHLSSASLDARHSTACCILELSLPDIHGAELIHLIRNLAQLQHLEYVVFSKSIDSLTEEHAGMLNGCRMVEKPLHALELQERFWEIVQPYVGDPTGLASSTT